MSQATLGNVLRYLRTACPGQLTQDLSDSELLQRFLAHREEAAFAVLVQRHGPMVLAVCRRVLGDCHSAEDAFQATFLILVRRAASIRNTGSLASWLYAVALHVAGKARAQTATRRHRERQAANMPHPEPLDDLTWQELRGVLDEEIGRLPEKYRAPIVLCYFEDKSYDEAAQELGRPKSSLAKRLTRARELLRRQLTRRGVALSSGVLAAALAGKCAQATVTALLTIHTVKAAAEGGLSPGTAALAEEALKPALGIKGKFVVMLVLLGLTVGGALVAAPWTVSPTSGPTQGEEVQASPTKADPSGQAKKDAPLVLDLYGDLLPDGAVWRLGTVRWRGGVRVTGLAFAPGGKVLASSGVAGFGLCLWDAATGKPLHRLAVPFICEKTPAFSPDGKTLVVAGRFRGQVNKLYLVEVATGKVLRRFEGPPGVGLDTVAFSRDGRTVATSESGGAGPTVVLWDIVAGTEVRRLPGHTDTIQSVAFSPDGKLLASVADDGTRVWDVATGKELYHLQGNAGAAFSPDSQWLAAGGQSDKTIRLLHAATGKEIRRWVSGQEDTWRLLFSPDGKLLVSSGVSGSGVSVWAVDTGKPVLALAVQGYIDALAFSASGRLLAAVVRHGRTLANGEVEETSAIHLWEVLSGQEIRRIDVSQGWVWALAFAPDGRTLASGGMDSTILLWDLTGGIKNGTSKTAALTGAELSGLWADLAGDAIQADRALWKLVRAPQQSLPYLKEHLRPVPPAEAKLVGRLLADLESENFAVRQKAARRLEELGDAAVTALRQALEGNPGLEIRQQLEKLLHKRTTEVVRQLRAVATLERIGTTEARQVLEALAKTTPHPRVAQAAGAALQRLAR